MADKDAATPRVYLIRHGETEWSRNGRYTGTTDLPLLPAGEKKILETASNVVGRSRLIKPDHLLRIYCSPRQRATRTLDLLLQNHHHDDKRLNIDTKITEDIREWSYGDYEGLKTHEILTLRKDRGIVEKDNRSKWDIWLAGAEGEGSESPADVTTRIDRIIGEIVTLHGDYLTDVKTGTLDKWDGKRDILIVAHGHILRAFVKRWLRLELGTPVELMLEPGGVCGLSYAHGNVDERAVLVGMSFPQGE